MSIQVIKKALGLLIVDLIIIIGIFVLQFRTDSSIIQKNGNLQITLTQNTEDGVSPLINKLQLSYNGINIYCDDEHPAQILRNGQKSRENIKLQDWKIVNESEYELYFTHDIVLTVSLTDNNDEGPLSFNVSLPRTVNSLFIPYNHAYNLKIQKDEGSRIVFDAKKNSWEMNAFSLDDGLMVFNKSNISAVYKIYDTTKKFTFDDLTVLAIADSKVYQQTINTFKNNLIQSFRSTSSQEGNLTEQTAVSYVAIMAERGNYTQAIEEIPQSFKKGGNRSYLSAPYFNTLEQMNKSLDLHINQTQEKIRQSAANENPDLFEIKNLANYLYIMKDKELVTKILEIPSNLEIANIPLAVATGILQTYVELYELKPEYANILYPALNSCVDRIANACNFQGSVLTISENDTFLSVIQAVETGVALHRFGLLTGNETLEKAGQVIVNSYMTESSSFDLRTLANIYSIFAYTNKYYPHFQKIHENQSGILWAWTCASDITYSKEEENQMSLIIDFPETYIHYVIIKGLPKFTTIYIYNMAFRTDPRFETYNSSGYVYKQDQTLLLKSRHRSKEELIRFDYTPKPAAKPAPKPQPKPAPAPAANGNQASESEVSAIATSNPLPVL